MSVRQAKRSARRKEQGKLEEDEAAADAEGYGFGAGGGAEFAEDGGYVEFGRVVGNVEAGGDFLVGEAGGQHLQDFALAAGERLGEFGEGLRRARRGWVDGGNFCGMQDDEACGRGLQRGGELIGGNLAGEDGANPGLQCLRERRGRGGFGEHDDGNFRCEVGVRERFDDDFGRFARGVNQEGICLRVGEVAA